MACATPFPRASPDVHALHLGKSVVKRNAAAANRVAVCARDEECDVRLKHLRDAESVALMRLVALAQFGFELLYQRVCVVSRTRCVFERDCHASTRQIIALRARDRVNVSFRYAVAVSMRAVALNGCELIGCRVHADSKFNLSVSRR